MSTTSLKRALRIERYLTDSMKELLDNGEITIQTNVLALWLTNRNKCSIIILVNKKTYTNYERYVGSISNRIGQYIKTLNCAISFYINLDIESMIFKQFCKSSHYNHFYPYQKVLFHPVMKHSFVVLFSLKERKKEK